MIKRINPEDSFFIGGSFCNVRRKKPVVGLNSLRTYQRDNVNYVIPNPDSSGGGIS